jgi:glucose-1-phosphate thymidylyltransferase
VSHPLSRGLVHCAQGPLGASKVQRTQARNLPSRSRRCPSRRRSQIAQEPRGIRALKPAICARSEVRGDRTRVRTPVSRSLDVQAKGVIVVPPADRQSGRLDATRATSLQRVANRPILCHVLDALASANVSEIVVVVPPRAAADIMSCIERHAAPAIKVLPCVHEYLREPAVALDAVAELIGEAPLIVHRADGLLGQPLAPFLELIGDGSPDVALLVTQGGRNAERLAPRSQRALRIAELRPTQTAFGVAGVCMLAPGALQHARATVWSDQGLELGGMAEGLASEGGRIHVRVVGTWHGFGGESVDLLAMNRAVLDSLDDGAAPIETDGNRFEGKVLIDSSASISSSVICGPAIVGAGAQVIDSYIGPHTSIGERVHVEGAEIERSIVLEGASIRYVGGRVVASVVGREARVFRDFSVPRAIRLQVGDGDEVALC